jgi:hypothetical protein
VVDPPDLGEFRASRRKVRKDVAPARPDFTADPVLRRAAAAHCGRAEERSLRPSRLLARDPLLLPAKSTLRRGARSRSRSRCPAGGIVQALAGVFRAEDAEHAETSLPRDHARPNKLSSKKENLVEAGQRRHPLSAVSASSARDFRAPAPRAVSSAASAAVVPGQRGAACGAESANIEERKRRPRSPRAGWALDGSGIWRRVGHGAR